MGELGSQGEGAPRRSRPRWGGLGGGAPGGLESVAGAHGPAGHAVQPRGRSGQGRLGGGRRGRRLGATWRLRPGARCGCGDGLGDGLLPSVLARPGRRGGRATPRRAVAAAATALAMASLSTAGAAGSATAAGSGGGSCAAAGRAAAGSGTSSGMGSATSSSSSKAATGRAGSGASKRLARGSKPRLRSAMICSHSGAVKGTGRRHHARNHQGGRHPGHRAYPSGARITRCRSRLLGCAGCRSANQLLAASSASTTDWGVITSPRGMGALLRSAGTTR